MRIDAGRNRNIDILSVRPAGMLPAALPNLAIRPQQAKGLLGAQAEGLCY
jgi:hypothetical protein